MKPLRRVTGRVAVLDRSDVDTDQIMPKQFLKRIERTGFGESVFYDWRKEPGFELNQPAYAGASVLITGRNFGCGSSREHAAWGLQDYGFDVIVAPSFSDIFRPNASKIGLLAITLAYDEVRSLIESVDTERGSEVTVDLETCTITAPDGRVIPFGFDETTRYRLLNGLDEIAITLQHEEEIAAYEAARRSA